MPLWIPYNATGSGELYLLNVLSKWFMNHIRPYADDLVRRLAEPRRFIQVITGSRQVGKTTLVQ